MIWAFRKIYQDDLRFSQMIGILWMDIFAFQIEITSINQIVGNVVSASLFDIRSTERSFSEVR